MTQTAVIDAQAATNTLLYAATVPAFTSEVYKSSWFDASAFRRLNLTLAMDEASAENGVVLEQSNDPNASGDASAHNWEAASTIEETHPVTGVVRHHVTLSVERHSRMARVVVKHASGTPPSALFSLALIGSGFT